MKEKGKRGGRLAEISPAFNPNIQIKILSKQNLETLHREFIALLSKNGNKNLKNKVKESLTEHYLDELNNLLTLKKWREADNITTRLMLHVADREGNYLDLDSLSNFSCKRLKDIDSLWVQHSNWNFGFRVQKQIWEETGNVGITDKWTKKDEENYQNFASRIGWISPFGSRRDSTGSSRIGITLRIREENRGYYPEQVRQRVSYFVSIPYSPRISPRVSQKTPQQIYPHILFSRCDL